MKKIGPTSTKAELAEEIKALKSQLEQATRQVKDIAVSVIDSRRPAAQPSEKTS